MATPTDRLIGVGDIIHRPLTVIEEPRTKPTVGILDAPVRCYIVNEEWAKHIVGAIEVLTEWRAWVDDTDERSDSVQEVLKMLSEENCMLFQLRQNPNDACVMEQSFDNGVTWSTVFDYSLCVSPAIASQSLNDSTDALNSLNTAYDGTVVSVAPDMVYDSTATDDIRDKALCHALMQLVDFMCEAELEYRRQIALLSAITLIIMAIIGAIITVATLGTAIPIYLAISASLAGGFGVLFGGLSEAIITDDTAKDAVVCCMRDALFGATITQTTFENSLDNCGFTGGTNEAQLSSAIAQLLTQSDMYVSFLDYMQRAYKLAELGIASCICDETWTSVLDLTISDYSFVYGVGQLGNPAGVWTNGVGIVGSEYQGDGDARVGLYGSWDFNETTVTSLRLEGKITRGSHSGYTLATIQRVVNNSIIYAPSQVTTPFTNYPVGVQASFNILSTGYTTTADEAFAFVLASAKATNGACILEKVTINGIGLKPPQLP